MQNLRSIDPREADFLQVTLALWRGDAAEMNELMSTMRDGDIVPKYPVAYRVRFYLLEAEYCCLSGSYSSELLSDQTRELDCIESYKELTSFV